MQAVFSLRGVQDELEVFEDKLTITPKGVLGFMNKGLKGTKTLLYISISAIQFKKGGMTNGYLQFSLPGGNESKGGVFAAVKDENTFMFKPRDNELAEKIRDYVESRVQAAKSPATGHPTQSLADELKKLAALRDAGVLSEQEFLHAKQKLMS